MTQRRDVLFRARNRTKSLPDVIHRARNRTKPFLDAQNKILEKIFGEKNKKAYLCSVLFMSRLAKSTLQHLINERKDNDRRHCTTSGESWRESHGCEDSHLAHAGEAGLCLCAERPGGAVADGGQEHDLPRSDLVCRKGDAACY